MIIDYLKRLVDITLQTKSQQILNKPLSKNQIKIFYITKGHKVKQIIDNAEMDLNKVIQDFLEEI